MVDYHAHLLPSLDDGAASVEEAVAMAEILSGFGFSVVHCTPHLIRGAYESAPSLVRSVTERLQAVLQEAGVALRLVPGTEHYLDEYLAGHLSEAITVEGSRHLLVEAPFRCAPDLVLALADQVLQRDFIPLIAHPERCSAFAPPREPAGVLARFFGSREKPDFASTLLARLKARGCSFQGNLGSFAGIYGEEVRRRALWFLDEGVYCCLGSDSHRAEGLEAMLTRGVAAVEAAVGRDETQRLLQGLPGSLKR